MTRHVVDSSAWLAYLADTLNAEHFAEPIEQPGALVVPVITIYEVYKRVLLQRDEGAAMRAAALMQQGDVMEIDASLTLEAAHLSLAHKLPMADSLILASARRADATLWTQDGDFQGIDGVRYFPVRSG